MVCRRQETVAAGVGKAPAERVSVKISVEALLSRSSPLAKSIQARASGVLSLLPSPVMPKAVRGGLPLALRARTVAASSGVAMLNTT